MSVPQEGLYPGTVVHSRLRPVSHRLRYRVFAVLFDCAALDALARRVRLFSRNRFNLISFHDSDHGNGGDLLSHLDELARQSGMGDVVQRFMMLCYPRILGYAFNPLTVYYGLDCDGRVRLVVYEVNNTFGQRQTYVLPVDPAGGNDLISQSCAKALYVSPFNTAAGTYSFHLTQPGDQLVVGVALRDHEGPVLKAHFRGERRPLTDTTLLQALAFTGWMTVKVFVGIHWEAAKLWLKGLPLQPRPSAPDRSTHFSKLREENSKT